jgi:hypothetical protein
LPDNLRWLVRLDSFTWFVVELEEVFNFGYPTVLDEGDVFRMVVVRLIVRLRIEFHGEAKGIGVFRACLAKALEIHHTGYIGKTFPGSKKIAFGLRVRRVY